MTKRNSAYIEIPTRDSAESGQFYAALLGWKITSLPETNYTMWDAGVGPNGGFSPVSDEFQAGDVSISVNSVDIESDLKKAVELGGRVVHAKSEIPGFGWFGTLKDPTGNRISLYTSLNPNA